MRDHLSSATVTAHPLSRRVTSHESPPVITEGLMLCSPPVVTEGRQPRSIHLHLALGSFERESRPGFHLKGSQGQV